MQEEVNYEKKRLGIPYYMFVDFGTVTLDCPHCLKKTYLGCDSAYGGKLYKLVGEKGKRNVEIRNIDCICGECHQPFRISNNYTIKRPKYWIEWNNDTRFNLGVSIFMLSFIPFMIFLFYSIYIKGVKKENIETTLFLNILIVLTVIMILGFFTSLICIIANNFIPIIKTRKVEEMTSIEHFYKHITIYERHKDIVKMEIELHQTKTQLYNQNNLIDLGGIFGNEKELQMYILENIECIFIDGKKLQLYGKGREVNIPKIGRIDILCKDESGQNLYILETKLNKIEDKTIGQITRYMGALQEYFPDKNIYGLIIGASHTDKLLYSVSALQNPNLYIYEYKYGLSFQRIY